MLLMNIKSITDTKEENDTGEEHTVEQLLLHRLKQGSVQDVALP